MENETELIERSKSGDQEAFCRLARSDERRIYRLALHYCQGCHDAEDLSHRAATGLIRTWYKPNRIEFGGADSVTRLSTVNGPVTIK